MQIKIAKLVYGGDGLARLPADEHGPGKTLFVPFVLEGEQVEATLTEQKPGFTRARVERIIEPSPERIEAACPHFQRCGGCHYQHANCETRVGRSAGPLFTGVELPQPNLVEASN